MAEADLDAVIRDIAKKQTKALNDAVKARHDRLTALAASAKDKDGRDRYRQLAKDTKLHAAAAIRRLQVSAANAADSYARAIKKAAEEYSAAAHKAAEQKAVKHKPAEKPAKAASDDSKAGKKAVKTVAGKAAKAPKNKAAKKAA